MRRKKRQKKSIIDPYATREIRGIFRSKPMIFLFNTAEHYRKLAENSRQKWSKSEPPDQKMWWEERMYSGSAFLYYVLYCEALLNNIWADFKKRKVIDLPEPLIKGLPKLPDERLPFPDRLFLTPFLCLEEPDYSKRYFSRQTNNFHKIIEIFQIRDSYVHARPTGREMKITIRQNSQHHLDDSNPRNFWQRTGICKDITLLSIHEIPTVKESADWLFSCLNNFLGNQLDNRNWREEESIEIDNGMSHIKSPFA